MKIWSHHATKEDSNSVPYWAKPFDWMSSIFVPLVTKRTVVASVRKKDTVMMAVTNVNNEQKLNGIKLQSPKEMWSIHVFYQKDSQRNLELNIGDGHGGPEVNWNFRGCFYSMGPVVQKMDSNIKLRKIAIHKP